MKAVLAKLSQARAYIRNNQLQKDGFNEFSKFDYYTPEAVGKMVFSACQDLSLICTFSLKQDTLGYYGLVTLTDLETCETLTTELRTDRPDIKATNITQQMGGMATYAKRYCLMSLFDIEDNKLDFDADQTRPRTTSQTKKPDLPWLDKTFKGTNNLTPEWIGVTDDIKGGYFTPTDVTQHFRVNKSCMDELIALKLNPAISDESFAAALDIAKKDSTIYHKTLKKYSLSADQHRELSNQCEKTKKEAINNF